MHGFMEFMGITCLGQMKTLISKSKIALLEKVCPCQRRSDYRRRDLMSGRRDSCNT